MITIVGPEMTRPLMAGIAAALTSNGHGSQVSVVHSLDGVPGLENTEILVTIMVPCGAREMALMPKLRGVVSPLLGYDWIDVEEATRRRIPVANSEVPENREAMAEATIMLLLVLLYRLHATEAALRMNRSDAESVVRHMLKGRRLGIIGYGGISRAVIERLEPWGAEIMISTRAEQDVSGNVRFVSLHELLASSDAILVLTSLNPETRGMLGAEQLRSIKPGAILVNTARGGLIDQSALVEQLRSGRIAAAALDVFEKEPLPPDHPLRDLPNVILTPHAIGHTEESKAAVPKGAAGNVLSLLQGKLPSSCRNPSVAEYITDEISVK